VPLPLSTRQRHPRVDCGEQPIPRLGGFAELDDVLINMNPNNS
jgi:hypothetical protein